jgi:AraC family transcriptional regulator of adaptative response/methylated-DNA-[protein]-cysteine methyltransferase
MVNEQKAVLDAPAEAMEDDARWQAVLAREERFDGRFVYAVCSTGIYCRPSCPSRRPNRASARFFAGPGEAEQEGFRACRRCRPREAVAPGVDVVQRICRYIEAHPDKAITLAALSVRAGLSPYHLQRLFKRRMGVTPHQYAAARRLERFKEQLKEGVEVTDALYGAGYGSSSQLYTQADERLGMTPSTYRKGGRGMNIAYTIADSPQGVVLLAATERGICAVYLGEVHEELEGELRKEFPAAAVRRDDTPLRPWVEELFKSLDGQPAALDLPLDVQATAFQSRVWAALRAIPRGSTRTYRQIAEAIGQPTAARAVGRACATNPVSLIIPCHRAVGGDGNLTGYRWGVERKQSLLAREARAAESGEVGNDHSV